MRDALARAYGLDPAEVRVVAQDVGGSFGAKSRPHAEEVLLPFLARRVGRPVLWVPDRSDDMVGLAHGRGQVQHVRIGGGRDGRIRAYEVHIVQDAGAYPGGGAMLPGNTKVMLTGCYEIPTAAFSADAAVTNTTPVGAYRGAGRPEAAAGLERAVDHFARAVGLDPAEVRRRNFLPPERFPLTTPSGTPYDSGNYAAALDRVLEASGYDELRAEQARRRAVGDRRLLGIGLATYVERTAGIFRPDYGAVELLADGGLRALTGSSPYGQGHHTAWAMLVSDRTGVPLERIEVVHGDTDLVPRGGITGGSRSVQSNGVAMWRAAGRLVDEARRLAAELLEASVDDVVLDTARGAFHVVGTPARALSWAELAARAVAGAGDGAQPAGSDRHRILHAEEDFEASGPTFPFGAHVAVVEVDAETGEVRLCRLVAVDDAGVILNPLLADGQVHGGLAQGAAQALWEGVRLRRRRQPADRQLRRLRHRLRGRAALLRAGAHGDAHPAQRARRQGHRRVGHRRRHAGGPQRGDRRRRPSRHRAPRHAAHAPGRVAGAACRRRNAGLRLRRGLRPRAPSPSGSLAVARPASPCSAIAPHVLSQPSRAACASRGGGSASWVMAELLLMGVTHYPPLALRDEDMAGIAPMRCWPTPTSPPTPRTRRTGPRRCGPSGATTTARCRRAAHRAQLVDGFDEGPRRARRVRPRPGADLG